MRVAVILVLQAACATTVTGTVFLDRNHDRIRQADEPGVANVVVALDRGAPVRTRADGSFAIAAATDEGIVWARVPDGFRPGPVWARGDGRVALPLAPLTTDELAAPLAFVVAADTHTTAVDHPAANGQWDGGDLDDAIAQALALATPPRFLTIVGDVTQANSDAEFARVSDTLARSGTPWIPVPGNHDWYDGLSAFTRLFCSDIGGRRLAGWWTRQRRSYFVLKLPHRWWLVASDGQLQSDLDVPQMEHFREIAERYMQPGDKVILCLSLPVWVYAQKYRNMGRVFDETDLIYLREEVFAKRGVDVKVYLTGDLHHYRRHEETRASAGASEPVQKITAGGGGAFLHPTHEEDVSVLREEPITDDVAARTFEAKTVYPSTAQSAWLAWGNLGFLVKNPRFGVVPATIYLMTAWLVGAAAGDVTPANPWQALSVTVQAFSTHPGLAMWCGAIVLGFFAFTDTHSRLYRVLGGLLHAVAHLSAMFYLGWGTLDISTRWLHTHGVVRAALAGVGTFAGGWVVGSVLMGVYLLISVNVFGRHSEEAFSALRIEDYKHFLRLHVGPDGRLTIWPIRLERVPRRWRDRAAGDATPSRVVPDEPLTAELIEPPIRVG